MFRRYLVAAVVVLALASSATAVLPAAAKTNKAGVTHKLIVAVKTNLAPAAEKKLAGAAKTSFTKKCVADAAAK